LAGKNGLIKPDMVIAGPFGQPHIRFGKDDLPAQHMIAGTTLP
jgi:hypothetical protein